MKNNFDIDFIIKQTEKSMNSEATTLGVRSLVQKGLLEQYTDEDGNFKFSLTKEGEKIAEFLFHNPSLLPDNDDNNENEKD